MLVCDVCLAYKIHLLFSVPKEVLLHIPDQPISSEMKKITVNIKPSPSCSITVPHQSFPNSDSGTKSDNLLYMITSQQDATQLGATRIDVFR